MVKRLLLPIPIVLTLVVLPGAERAAVPAPDPPYPVAVGDWPEARGPHRTGVSDEKGLIDTWTLNGRNFRWRAPYGGRSAPIVAGNRVYVQNPAGLGDAMQERVMALDADTGKL